MATKTKAKAKTDPTRPDMVLAWHFLPENMCLTNGDGRKAEVGKTLTDNGFAKPLTCHHGMHASINVMDAAAYTRGPVISRVEVWGDVDKARDKISGRNRKVLWMKKLTINDIKSCFAAIGHKPQYPVTSLHDYVGQLGNLDDKERNLAGTWLENFASQNGCPKTSFKEIPFVHVKPEITTKILKSLLNDRVVKSQAELLNDVKDAFDCSDMDDGDLWYDLGCDNDVCIVEDYAANGIDGYVLKRKPAPKKKH